MVCGCCGVSSRCNTRAQQCFYGSICVSRPIVKHCCKQLTTPCSVDAPPRRASMRLLQAAATCKKWPKPRALAALVSCRQQGDTRPQLVPCCYLWRALSALCSPVALGCGIHQFPACQAHRSLTGARWPPPRPPMCASAGCEVQVVACMRRNARASRCDAAAMSCFGRAVQLLVTGSADNE